VSDAWDRTASAAGVGTVTPQAEGENAGLDSLGTMLVKQYLGSELLFACYEFYGEYKNKPKNWLELFECMQVFRIKNALREIEMAKAAMQQHITEGG